MARGLEFGLREEGFRVLWADTGEQALDLTCSRVPQLILLEIRLLDISGFDICRHIRTEGKRMPILILTARDEVLDSEKIILIINKPESHLSIKSDRKLLELALSNLLENALKFTPPGGEVLIGADKNDEHIYLWASDTGPGISPNELPYIFERFYQGRNSTVEGSGLGLAMIKNIVSEHNREVNVISELDSGREFRIILPTDTNSVERLLNHFHVIPAGSKPHNITYQLSKSNKKCRQDYPIFKSKSR